jgi:hypothetical protein
VVGHVGRNPELIAALGIGHGRELIGSTSIHRLRAGAHDTSAIGGRSHGRPVRDQGRTNRLTALAKPLVLVGGSGATGGQLDFMTRVVHRDVCPARSGLRRRCRSDDVARDGTASSCMGGWQQPASLADCAAG